MAKNDLEVMENGVAVMWSGGKDCFLSLLLSRDKGDNQSRSDVLVTIINNSDHTNGNIYNSDLPCILKHSDALNARHLIVLPLYSKGYCDVSLYRDIGWVLKNTLGCNTLLFGDIFSDEDTWRKDLAEKGGCSACVPVARSTVNLGIKPMFPLAGTDAETLLEMLEHFGVQGTVHHTVQKYCALLGHSISRDALLETGLYHQKNFDLMGEGGEYQTIVTGYGQHKFDLSPHIIDEQNERMQFSINTDEVFRELKFLTKRSAAMFFEK